MLEEHRHHNVAKVLRKIAILIGEVLDTPVVLSSGEAVLPGLGLTASAGELLDRVTWIERGYLRLAVVGAVSRGKSTLVNALLGASRLPVDIEACTGVITQVVYGDNINEVAVVESGKSRSLVWEDFLNTVRLTPEEQGSIRDGNTFMMPERLTRIDYAVLECEHGLGEQGLHIVDTLGFRAGRKAEEITKAFLVKTDVLVFVTRAQPLFEEADQEFLETQLRLNESRLEHIFFVINDFGGLNEAERAEVMENARIRLKDYFLTADGSFDVSLFERRVFVVNARDALEARLEGTDADSLQATGLPALERAIQQMLNDEELLPTVLEATTVQVLIPALDEASRSIRQEKWLLSKDLSELEHTQQEIEGRLAELTRQADDLQDTFNTFAQRVAERTADHFEDYTTRMMDEWETIWIRSDAERNFGIKDVTSTVFSKENRRTFAAMIEGRLQSHFAAQMSLWESEVLEDLESDIEEMSASLEEKTHSFLLGLDEVRASMTDAEVPQLLYIDQGLIKRVTSVFASTLDSNLISGKFIGMGVKALTRHYIFPLSIAAVGVAVVWMSWLPPGALVASFIVSSAIRSRGYASLSDRAFDRMRNAIGKALREKLKNSMPTMKLNIRIAIRDRFKVYAEKLLGTLQAEIRQVRSQLESAVSKKRAGEAEVAAEISRLDAIDGHLTELFEQIGREVYGRALTDEEYERLCQGNTILSENV